MHLRPPAPYEPLAPYALFGNNDAILNPLEESEVAIKNQKTARVAGIQQLVTFTVSVVAFAIILTSISILIAIPMVHSPIMVIAFFLVITGVINLGIGINSLVRMKKELCNFFGNREKTRNISEEICKLQANAFAVIEDQNSSDESPQPPPLAHNGFPVADYPQTSPDVINLPDRSWFEVRKNHF